MATRKKLSNVKVASTASYEHKEAKAIIRPEAGAQTRFKKKKPSATYRYDSSLAPELQWDALNPAREQGECRLAELETALAAVQATLAEVHERLSLAPSPPAPLPGGEGSKDLANELASLLQETRIRIGELQKEPLRAGREALSTLKALSRPFLNWAGKAERLSFEVPTLPLFIHERLSTQAILNSVDTHKLGAQRDWISDFFGHPERSLPEQLRLAYEHPNGWQNRMILGDSLVVMNSLLHYENMGGSVQMIYIDPPYGVKFGSNFQPFVRKRDVTHNEDEAFTREPEMVKAYRDTWELGLHSYLTYLRDRLLLARDLLTDSGSVFVQISDENLHHVTEVMEEVFGEENCVSVITVKKTGAQTTNLLPPVSDYLIWFAKDVTKIKYRQLFWDMKAGEGYSTGERYDQALLPTGKVVTAGSLDEIPPGTRFFRLVTLSSNRPAKAHEQWGFEFEGKTFYPPANRTWTTTKDGLTNLVAAGRVRAGNKSLNYTKYLDDFPANPVGNLWDDVAGASDKLYVVQTATAVIQRCMLMTTDPGDLVLDPTCGSGTTAFVAENWGRRWITMDTSRVPLALARQRLLTTPYKYWQLKEPGRGPAGGFVYKEKKNRKGEHVGGIVPHITLGSIANNEAPKHEVLVDRPEEQTGVTRVCGPFVFEATIPAASNFDGDETTLTPTLSRGEREQGAQDFVDRMLEVLRSSPVLYLAGGKTVSLSGIRRPAKTLYLSAEAVQLPSPAGRGAGGEGKHAPLPADLLQFARDLRHSQTDAESLMWSLLRDRRLAGMKFRRQHPVEPYVLDFYGHEAKLAIELDGGQHNEDAGRRSDEKRTRFLQTQGIRILRFWDNDVLGQTESVLEAIWNALNPSPPAPLPEGEGGEAVALLFGPEHGPVSELAVLNAWQEATAKAFSHLYVIGFAIEPKARQSIGEYSAMGMPTTYVQATPDILMGDLLKNMRSSQIFSVCGQPDVAVREIPTPEDGIPNLAYYEVKLNGLDVFDPVTMDLDTRSGLDVPAWFLDTDYNGMVFRVCQAFFPRTQAWDNLKRALKADFDDSVWAHLAGDTSTPFNAGQHKQIAVKVIDDRGNELMVVRPLEGGK